MLPKGMWKAWEPRVILPTFKGVDNIVDFSVQPSLNKAYQGIIYTLAYPLYNVFKKRSSIGIAFKHYQNILFRSKIVFRIILLSRSGEYIHQWNVPGKYSPGDYFRIDLQQLSAGSEYTIGDNLIIVVASRGRNDSWMSSPGSLSIKYVSRNSIAGLRTGLFSRPLNEGGKGHFGFTGVNPKIMFKKELEPSILLINHSSDPSYSRSVTPTIRLYRRPGEYIEKKLGEIPPNGARETRILQVFPEVSDYLAETNMTGCTIAQVKGATLSSYHLFRNKNDDVVAMDHSRPSHTNIIGK